MVSSGSEESRCDIVVALTGNPNVGKSTLFNVLTGESVRVGNWPGVTVELKYGVRDYKGRRLCLVDLPGIYGISATSREEVISREFMIAGNADVIVVLVDSTSPERTMYLAIQVLELTPNVIIAFTKVDEAHSKGIHIHFNEIERDLKVPVIATAAIRGEGIRELLDAIVGRARRGDARNRLVVDYGVLEPFIKKAESFIREGGFLPSYPSRWVAVRLLEGDPRLEEILAGSGGEDVIQRISEVRATVRKELGIDVSEYLVKKRFEFVDHIARKAIVRTAIKARARFIEEVLQKPVIGPAVSTIIIFLTFFIAFALNTGFPLNIVLNTLGLSREASAVEEFSLSGLLSAFFGWLSRTTSTTLSSVGPVWLSSLISNGIITGVGSVLTFLPLIFLVSVLLAMLEDSGLAPRMAVSLHTFFSKFGLSGRAIYPFIISLGCNVPAVLASRTSIDEHERYELIFSVPFIPCQARLVVALAFATAFFNDPLSQALTIFFVYVIGTAVALITSLIIRRLWFKDRAPPELLLELPPIHSPKARVVWWLSWDSTKHFLRKAGIIIFALSVVVWLLVYTGPQGYLGPTGDVASSYASVMGRAIAPALAPLGLRGGDAWRLGFALINGFVAKEVVLDSLVVVYGGGEDPINVLKGIGISRAQALSILTFVTLYVPCLATLAVILQESRSIKMTLLAIVYMLSLAYVTSLLVFLIANAVLA
ncbi:MAG: ferrous iron transport protein B [Desulfurococcales archaeon ex4484_204]|nr:MAG: ferrous iron transport protein B [Desulfurococcales archaeon ex4484_204]